LKKIIKFEKIPNRLTLARMIITIAFIPCTLTNNIILNYVALLLFAIGSYTDYLDGYIARKYKIVSDFGKIMDPVADKMLVFSAMICFVQLGIVQAWMVLIIIGRDFFVSGLRTMAAKKGGEIIEASRWGKTKTLTQIISILVILALIAIQNTIEFYASPWEQSLMDGGFVGHAILYLIYYAPYWLMFIAAIMALLSGFDYFLKNRRFFDNQV